MFKPRGFSRLQGGPLVCKGVGLSGYAGPEQNVNTLAGPHPGPIWPKTVKGRGSDLRGADGGSNPKGG